MNAMEKRVDFEAIHWANDGSVTAVRGQAVSTQQPPVAALEPWRPDLDTYHRQLLRNLLFAWLGAIAALTVLGYVIVEAVAS